MDSCESRFISSWKGFAYCDEVLSFLRHLKAVWNEIILPSQTYNMILLLHSTVIYTPYEFFKRAVINFILIYSPITTCIALLSAPPCHSASTFYIGIV